MYKITLTDGREVAAEEGQSLFTALREAGIFVPTICGGKGFCNFCNDNLSLDILEIDAASNNRVDEIRELKSRNN